MTSDLDLIPGVDYEPAVCMACGKDEHTAAELAECIASVVATFASCGNCGRNVPDGYDECDSCGMSMVCD